MTTFCAGPVARKMQISSLNTTFEHTERQIRLTAWATPRASHFKFQISNTKFQIEQSRPAAHAVTRANSNGVGHNRRPSAGKGVTRTGRIIKSYSTWLGHRAKIHDAAVSPEFASLHMNSLLVVMALSLLKALSQLPEKLSDNCFSTP